MAVSKSVITEAISMDGLARQRSMAYALKSKTKYNQLLHQFYLRL